MDELIPEDQAILDRIHKIVEKHTAVPGNVRSNTYWFVSWQMAEYARDYSHREAAEMVMDGYPAMDDQQVVDHFKYNYFDEQQDIEAQWSNIERDLASFWTDHE